MSKEKDKIREMVMALAQSKADPTFLEVARAAGAEVMAAKTERISDEMFLEAEAEVDDGAADKDEADAKKDGDESECSDDKDDKAKADKEKDVA